MKTNINTEQNGVQTHSLTDLKNYPCYHFPIFRGKKEVWVHSNVKIEKGDILKEGKDLFKVLQLIKVEKSVNELTGYWDTQGSGKNQKRKWVEPRPYYSKELTKYYTLKIEKI